MTMRGRNVTGRIEAGIIENNTHDGTHLKVVYDRSVRDCILLTAMRPVKDGNGAFMGTDIQVDLGRLEAIVTAAVRLRDMP